MAKWLSSRERVGVGVLRRQPASLYRTRCPSALWMLIDFAAGGWSQCAQKMNVRPETTHVSSDSTRWRASECGALFKLVL